MSAMTSPRKTEGWSGLKEFVDREHIPWPQYYQGHDNARVVTGSPTNDFWSFGGSAAFPRSSSSTQTASSTRPRRCGRLGTLIPRLLKESGKLASGR